MRRVEVLELPEVVRRTVLPEPAVEPEERRVCVLVPLDVVVRLFCEDVPPLTAVLRFWLEELTFVVLRLCEEELPLRVDVVRRLWLEELPELEERRLLWEEEPPVERVVLVVLLFWVERLV